MFHCRAIIIRNGEIIPMSREFTPETERQRLQFLVRKTFLLTSFLLNHLPAPSQPPMLPAGLPSWWAPRGRGQPHSWDVLMALVHPSQLAGLGRGTGMRGAAPAHWRGGISWLVEPWFAAGSAGDPGLSAWGRFGAVAWRCFSHLVLLLPGDRGAPPAAAVGAPGWLAQ